LFGFLGLSNISLNLFTATIFSITIGVGIDYAVHFTSVWMNFKNKGYDSEQAVEKAYNYTSRPIMANAFGLAIGLSALLMSPLKIHLYVSMLMWVSMISGVFLSLSFLPTILKKIK
jgi:predicted RND superfamily exporter protein